MHKFLWIGAAGACGTWLRYLIGLGATRALGPAFPWGTLFVNLLGCFLMAFVVETALHKQASDGTLRIVLTTGFLGGLTTYSSFNLETTKLFSERGLSAAGLNFAATTVGCLVSGLLGLWLARRVSGIS